MRYISAILAAIVFVTMMIFGATIGEDRAETNSVEVIRQVDLMRPY